MYIFDSVQSHSSPYPLSPLGSQEPTVEVLFETKKPTVEILDLTDLAPPFSKVDHNLAPPFSKVDLVPPSSKVDPRKLTDLAPPFPKVDEDTDRQLMSVQKVIDQKRKYLLEKQMYIQHLEKQNKFLREVRNDYNTYNQYMVKQRQDQILALHILNEYVQDLAISGKLTKTDLEDARQEQQNVLSEIGKLKGSLGTIVQGTDDIYSSLRDKMKG
jgi:hypothetical protein